MNVTYYPNPALRVPIAGRGAYPPPAKKHAGRVDEGKTETTVVYREAFPVAELPYGLKERHLVDHQVRTSHRRHLPGSLVRVIAHWVDRPLGELPWSEAHDTTPAPVVVSSKTPAIPRVPAVGDPPSGRDGGVVNVRLLVVPVIAHDPALFTAGRIRVVASGELGKVAAYGGPVPRSSDEGDMVRAAAALVKAQCGVDFSEFHWHRLCELLYKDRPPTVFYVPTLRRKAAAPGAPKSAPLAPAPQVTPGGGGEDTVHVVPLQFSLQALREHEVTASTPHDTLEFLAAVDALDEWGRRDMACRIREALLARGEEYRTLCRLQDTESERVQRKRRRREEEEASTKRARMARDAELKAQWCEEDEGKTDEQKRTAMQARRVVLVEKRAKDGAEDAERAARWGAEDAAEEEPVKETIGTVETPQPRDLEAFQYLDRDGAWSLPRLRLQNLLLCVDPELAVADVDALLALPQLPRRLEHLPYRKLTVKITPAPKHAAP